MPYRNVRTPSLQRCFHCGALAPIGANEPRHPCVACRIEMVFGIVRRWALSLRYEPRRLFLPYDIVRFKKRVLLQSNSLPRDVAIKVREQCLRELKTSAARAIQYDPGNSRRRSTASLNPYHQDSTTRLRQLIAGFSQLFGNKCYLCGADLGELGGVDMALPVHLNHSNIATERRHLFWSAAIVARLVMLCCPACNFKKGVLEKAGLTVLTSLFHGRARWQIDEVSGRGYGDFTKFQPRQLMFDGFADEADVPQTTQAYPPEWLDLIADVIQAFALRVSCTADLSRPQLLACWVRDDATQITFTPAFAADQCTSQEWGTRVGIVEWPGSAGR